MVFYTCLPLSLKICLIGEDSSFLEWGRDAQDLEIERPPTPEDGIDDESDLDEILCQDTVTDASVEKFEVWKRGEAALLCASAPGGGWQVQQAYELMNVKLVTWHETPLAQPGRSSSTVSVGPFFFFCLRNDYEPPTPRTQDSRGQSSHFAHMWAPRTAGLT